MKTVLFDIGNVLLAFDFKPALESISGNNPDPDAFHKIMQQKDEFEAGRQDKEEYINWVLKLLDSQVSMEEFEKAWTSIFTPIQASWHLARELKTQGHQLILYSNTNCIHAPYCLETYTEFALFDGAVFSHEVNAIKPENEFYQRAIEKFSIEPKNTLYIDDLEANIQAGEKFGIKGFVYNQYKHESFLEEFYKFI